MGIFLVTGGTGRLGREVARRLESQGNVVHIGSRRPDPGGLDGSRWVRLDYRDPVGLERAFAAVDGVVHCAASWSGSVDRAVVAAAAATRVGHLVYVSVVGAERIPLGYYRAKAATERRLVASDIPYSILRSTQFHSLLADLFEPLSRLPLLPLPSGIRMQPIDVGEVADRVCDLVRVGPTRSALDIGGPEIRPLEGFAASFLAAARRRARPVRLPLRGRVVAAFRAGVHLVPDRAVGRLTFEDYLERRLRARVTREAVS